MKTFKQFINESLKKYIVYHRTDKESFDTNKPFTHFTDDINFAKQIQAKGHTIYKIELSFKNPYIRPEESFDSKLGDYFENLKKDGYDGYIGTYRNGKEYVNFYPNQAKILDSYTKENYKEI